MGPAAPLLARLKTETRSLKLLTLNHDVVFERDGRVGCDLTLVDPAVLLGDPLDDQTVAQLTGVLQAEALVRGALDIGGEQRVVTSSPYDHRVIT